MRSEGTQALVVLADPVLANHSEAIARLATQARLPAASSYPEHAQAGGLLSYGPDLSEPRKVVASYIDKILRGSKPGELPVQRATKFLLVINVKAARTLGITVPQSLLLRADELIH